MCIFVHIHESVFTRICIFTYIFSVSVNVSLTVYAFITCIFLCICKFMFTRVCSYLSLNLLLYFHPCLPLLYVSFSVSANVSLFLVYSYTCIFLCIFNISFCICIIFLFICTIFLCICNIFPCICSIFLCICIFLFICTISVSAISFSLSAVSSFCICIRVFTRVRICLRVETCVWEPLTVSAAVVLMAEEREWRVRIAKLTEVFHAHLYN